MSDNCKPTREEYEEYQTRKKQVDDYSNRAMNLYQPTYHVTLESKRRWRRSDALQERVTQQELLIRQLKEGLHLLLWDRHHELKAKFDEDYPSDDDG